MFFYPKGMDIAAEAGTFCLNFFSGVPLQLCNRMNEKETESWFYRPEFEKLRERKKTEITKQYPV